MDNLEREAVLSLVPYFDQDNRIVFDVGSNKGEWADLLVQNVDAMHLFEPNIKLLHYTEIKYCELENVFYSRFGLANERGVRDYYEYQRQYNGLSGIYNNSKWGNLPYRIEKKLFIRLDSCDYYPIDLLKIDVEGAEWDVIQGAENLLKENKIKFIQIEYSEHYQVPGYTFQSIIDFVKPFGYELYDFDGHFFKADFKEDYVRKNYYFMQEFTEDWNQPFRKNTEGLKFNLALEIGCFEGLTTCHICDFLLNPDGRVICIDPLEDEYLTEKLDKKARKQNKELKQFKGQYDRFIRNTKGKPVELIRKRSNEAFKLEGFNEYQFNFIYIDGDHREKSVYNDACSSWEVLADKGYLLFDDYKWGSDTQRGINRFLKKVDGYYNMIVKDYQVMIQKNIP